MTLITICNFANMKYNDIQSKKCMYKHKTSHWTIQTTHKLYNCMFTRDDLHFTSSLGRVLGLSISFGLAALSCLIGTPIAVCRLCCSNSSLGDTTYTTTAQPVTPTAAVTVTMASSQKGGSQDYLATKTNVKEAPPAPHENFTERSPPSYEMSVYPPQMTSPTTPQEA